MLDCEGLVVVVVEGLALTLAVADAVGGTVDVLLCVVLLVAESVGLPVSEGLVQGVLLPLADPLGDGDAVRVALADGLKVADALSLGVGLAIWDGVAVMLQVVLMLMVVDTVAEGLAEGEVVPVMVPVVEGLLDGVVLMEPLGVADSVDVAVGDLVAEAVLLGLAVAVAEVDGVSVWVEEGLAVVVGEQVRLGVVDTVLLLLGLIV